jgi:hypothetical protein
MVVETDLADPLADVLAGPERDLLVESVCGTSSPMSRSVWAAYLEAMVLGDKATDSSESMAPISLKMSVLP